MGLEDKAKLVPAAPAPLTTRQESDRPESPDAGASGGNKLEGEVVPAPAAPTDSRKLIRNARLDLQVVNYRSRATPDDLRDRRTRLRRNPKLGKIA